MKYLALCLMLFSLPVQAGECPGGPYVYNAEVSGVYDSDTITATVDLGFHTFRVGEKFRLFESK